VYKVIDREVVILVIAVSKREGLAVYETTANRV
jgi:hypothetical protein